MNQVVIGIPTYKRPEMLEKLILSIYASQINHDLIDAINIVVVDNDSERTAEFVIDALKSNCILPFTIHYFNYPKKGLTHVRNEILKQSLKFNPEYIAFVDDDEYVTENWLNELVKTMINTNADIVQGPNLPVFEKEVPDYISRWFHVENFETNTQMELVESNNLLIKSKFLDDHNLRFDSRFDQTGGEDTFFGVQALEKGARIFWSHDAIVYETIPEKRATLKWLMRRIYRSASTFTYILKLKKSYVMLIRKFFISILYLIFGICSLAFLPFSHKHKYLGLTKISEACGGFAGMINLRYKEYAENN
ncbi:glycosyltransferase [Maribacter sp. 2308TA10-17]|uniref:glycosyltransferase n=1 Tax=Maribacter sp. 2308TA10-17 TaxID=3386276 RepID=UPI0039BCACA8